MEKYSFVSMDNHRSITSGTTTTTTNLPQTQINEKNHIDITKRTTPIKNTTTTATALNATHSETTKNITSVIAGGFAGMAAKTGLDSTA